MFWKASMNLREWTSNNPDVRNQFIEKETVTENPIKVLGLVWDYKEDKLSIQAPKWKESKGMATKRPSFE